MSKIYLVKLNDVVYIGEDLLVATYVDIFSQYPPDVFHSLSEAEEVAEKYHGEVVRFIPEKVDVSRCCANCKYAVGCIADNEIELPMIYILKCRKEGNAWIQVKRSHRCEGFAYHDE